MTDLIYIICFKLFFKQWFSVFCPSVFFLPHHSLHNTSNILRCVQVFAGCIAFAFYTTTSTGGKPLVITLVMAFRYIMTWETNGKLGNLPLLFVFVETENFGTYLMLLANDGIFRSC